MCRRCYQQKPANYQSYQTHYLPMSHTTVCCKMEDLLSPFPLVPRLSCALPTALQMQEKMYFLPLVLLRNAHHTPLQQHNRQPAPAVFCHKMPCAALVNNYLPKEQAFPYGRLRTVHG